MGNCIQRETIVLQNSNVKKKEKTKNIKKRYKGVFCIYGGESKKEFPSLKELKNLLL